MAKTFRAVEVSTLSNNGQSTPKYNKPVTLNINYDPQGLSVELVSGTDAARDLGRASGSFSRRRQPAPSLGDAADRSRDRAAHPGDITALILSRRPPLFSAPSAGRDRARAVSRPRSIADRRRSRVIGKGRWSRRERTRVLVLSFFSLSFFFIICLSSFETLE